jgi:hypothetical protein
MTVLAAALVTPKAAAVATLELEVAQQATAEAVELEERASVPHQ